MPCSWQSVQSVRLILEVCPIDLQVEMNMLERWIIPAMLHGLMQLILKTMTLLIFLLEQLSTSVVIFILRFAFAIYDLYLHRYEVIVTDCNCIKVSTDYFISRSGALY